MLSLIIDEALKGTDIAARYPAYFKKLLANAELREAFLDSLDLLEQSRRGKLAPLPEAPSLSLDFLKQDMPQVIVDSSTPQHWQAVWRQTAVQIQRIFSLTDLITEPTYRFENSFTGEDWFVLFHDRAEVDGAQLEIALEAIQPIDNPMSLRLTAIVALTPGPMTQVVVPQNLKATLEWGSYGETVAVNDHNQAVFPPLSLDAILDEVDETVSSDLLLMVEPA